MKKHIDSHLDAIKRHVRLFEKDGKPAASVQLARHFDVDPRALWHAVTSREEISDWFSPVSGDFTVGGSYAIQGNASGTIEACEPPTHVALTWEFAEDVSWVDLRLDSESRSGVSLRLTHTSVLSPHWEQYGAGATGVGWEMSYLGLHLHLMHRNKITIDERAFTASQEGKQFIIASSQAWAHAATLAGTESETAIAAAERTTAFYLGV